MLGHGPHIVATTRTARDMPAFRKLIPGIQDLPLAGAGGSLNVEELMRLRPQVLFLSQRLAPAQERQLRNAGIAVASFRANSVAALRERVSITADILGPDARERAARYQAYFDANNQRVKQALARVGAAQRVSVYHAVGSPLSTSGRPSLNQDWMDLAHVRNVAEDWFGTARASGEVTVEQVMAADPDVIVAMRASDARHIRTDARWRRLRAVREGRVYANPRGMFWWGRETSEVALQPLWLAKMAYPKQMAGVDMREETRRFYRTFYGYEPGDAELAEFLQPTSP
jgi:iron complex transport system substrate-binding protein